HLAIISFPTRRSSDLVGYGANTMGFYVTEKLLEEFDDDDDEKYRTMIGIINDAYYNTIKALYSTVINPVTDNDKLERIILGIIEDRKSTRLNSSHVSI